MQCLSKLAMDKEKKTQSEICYIGRKLKLHARGKNFTPRFEFLNVRCFLTNCTLFCCCVIKLKTKYSILLYLACFPMLSNPDFFYTFLRGLYFWIYLSVVWLDMLNASSGLSHVVLTFPHFLFSSFCSHPGWLLCPVTVIQEVVCNEILNIAEKSVHYCSTLSQPVFCHKGPFSDNKSSFIISQQPQVLPLETGLDRNHATREV